MDDDARTPDAALQLWLQSLDLPSYGPSDHHPHKKVLQSLGDIVDGEILWQVLATLDPTFFRASRPSSVSGALSEVWVLRFTSFKKMYKLIVRYFEEVLRQSMKDFLPGPNLQKIAKNGDLAESSMLCMIILTLATLAQPDVHVPKMQSLPTWAQTALMVGIESVSSRLVSLDTARSPMRNISRADHRDKLSPVYDGHPLSASGIEPQNGNPDHADELKTLQIEKETLQALCDSLNSEFQSLRQSNQDLSHKLFMTEQDLKTSQEELSNLQIDHASSDQRNRHDQDEEEEEAERKNQQNYILRSERDALRVELTNLGVKLDQSEALNERQTSQIEEMKRKLDDLGDVEEQNRGLKDQLDEVRHEMERARKLENVIEKYKKKLDESADLRRQLKMLEEQNTDLLDRNTSLEDEYRKVVTFKPLMEQYKSQIATLESQVSHQKRETDRLQYELDTTALRLRETEEERDREGEELALYEERVKELEEEVPVRHTRRRNSRSDGEEEGDDSTLMNSSFNRQLEEETGIIEGIGGELNDAIEGRTMTSLKLELRKLKREIKILRNAGEDEGADGMPGTTKSKCLVLENLLEDANRMKKKYEDDYLRQYRETLVLSSQLEEIRSGKSNSGDGTEATIALRQRLNETVAELEKIKIEHAELVVAYDQVNSELTVAKSDLHLVGKDQLEILSSLKDSVSAEKVTLSNEVERLKKEQSGLRDQLTMKTEQISSLLLEQVHLQSDSIDQRERMLIRERQVSTQLGSSQKGEMSNGDRAKLAVAEQLCKERSEECKVLKTKLDKAKLFIMNQDKLYRESMGSGNGILPVDVSSLTSNLEEIEQAHTVKVNELTEKLSRLKTQYTEMEARYEKELRLMGSAWHNLGQQRLRETIALNQSVVSRGTGAGASRTVSSGFEGLLRPSSWMKVQRERELQQHSLRPK